MHQLINLSSDRVSIKQSFAFCYLKNYQNCPLVIQRFSSTSSSRIGVVSLFNFDVFSNIHFYLRFFLHQLLCTICPLRVDVAKNLFMSFFVQNYSPSANCPALYKDFKIKTSYFFAIFDMQFLTAKRTHFTKKANKNNPKRKL